MNEQPKRDKFAGLTRKAKRRKLAMEEDERAGDNAAVNAAIRSAKKAARPSKIGLPESKMAPRRSKDKRKKSTSRKVTGHTGTFDRDMGEKKAASREGVRAKRGDIIGGMSKKKGTASGKRKGKR